MVDQLPLSISLQQLLDDQTIPADLLVGGIKMDSRYVAANDAFIAVNGCYNDGRDYIDDAISRGAIAIISEQAVMQQVAVPVFVVSDLASRLGELAAKAYALTTPLKVIGVTGTNGKTTCTHLLGQMLNGLQAPCGLIGTLGCGMPGALEDTGMTTPDVFSVHKHLAHIDAQGAVAVAMEVSSHGLGQGRVDGVEFHSALITNLTRDHLDYHGTMQAYGEAKKKLFTRKNLQLAIVNADDEFTAGLPAQLDSSVRAISYGITNKADVWVSNVTYHGEGITAHLHSPWGEGELRCALLGPFNLSNVLAVISLLGGWGYSLDTVLAQVEQLKPVPGRMQIVPGAGPLVIVDYAHTPDALEQALRASRIHCEGRLQVVFGCGGDRDQGKRAQMGRIADKYADSALVTSDNPRSENPASIVAMVAAGFAEGAEVACEVDRAKAITQAITQAAANDCVLVAGKGHENYQEIAGQRIDFDDVLVAQQAFALRGVA